MVYDSCRGYWIVDLEEGGFVRGLISADTSTGLVKFYEGGYNCWERYRHEDGTFGIKRKIISKICAFDVREPRGPVIDKARP